MMATVNPWRRFIGLLPGGASTVGEVIDVDEGAGTCRVRLRNNVVIAARGTAVPAGQMAFISDGLVTGPAPQLPQFDIEV
ncbi:TPA: hypothetical protein ACPFJF_003730 [Pseudomonas aeruginosa]